MSLSELVQQQLEDQDDEDLIDFVSECGDEIEQVEPPPVLDTKFPTTLFICNVPKVSKEKYDKLMNVLGKLIDKYGPNERNMPMNPETGMTQGFLFVEYQTVDSAARAAQTLNGMSLDRSHTFKVVKFDDFDAITSRPDEFQAQRTLNTFSRADFRLWLQDSKCREQLLLRYQNETEIYWLDPLVGAPVLCYGGEDHKRAKKIWCDWRVEWSPLGSYLATFHKQGIALWGGPQFTKKARLACANVKSICFSPNEDYLISWNGSHPSENDDHAVKFFQVLTGECVRECRTPLKSPTGDEWPHFSWSPDGKFFAECCDSAIIVRDCQTFELIKDEEGKRRTLKFESLSTFQWSPKDNKIAVWTLEQNNNPARLVIVDIPSRVEVASRSRTQVEATMHWQSAGDYLCLLVTKLSKTKKREKTNIEIFRIRDKNVPVDIVEVQDMVKGFFWETKGSRFAIITTDEAGHKPKLIFYKLGKEKCENVCSIDLPSNSFNTIFWAPDGQYFVCAATGHGAAGDLLFGGLMPDNKLEVYFKDEHYMLNNVQWDPSSRYVMTAVTQPHSNEAGGFRFSMEAGYALWTFQGRLIHRQIKEKLYEIGWRPHPPCLLSEKKQADVRTNIKQFTKRYDAHDDKEKDAARNAFRNERKSKTDEFQSVLDRLLNWKEDTEEENGWAEAWGEFHEQCGWETSETTHEEELTTSEELISG